MKLTFTPFHRFMYRCYREGRFADIGPMGVCEARRKVARLMVTDHLDDRHNRNLHKRYWNDYAMGQK